MSDKNNPRTFYEELNVAGNQLVEKIESLIKEGNVRRLIIKDANGKTLVEMPLTIGVVVGTGLAWVAMPLAVVGAVAALVARVQVIIERYENPEDAEKEREEAAPSDRPTA